MTADEFRRSLHTLPASEFATAVAALNQKERKALRAVIKEEKQALDERSFLGPIMGRDYMRQIEKQRKGHDKWLRKNPVIEDNLILAVFACGTAKEIERASTWRLEEEGHKAIDAILADRKPSWLSGWVNRQLDTEFHGLRWDTVWSLYRAGVIEKPDSDGYTELFVNAMRGFDSQAPETYVPTSERLLAEPELLEDEIWRIFEIENTALTQEWEAKYYNAPGHYQTWSTAIVRLANDGHLDRDRLLDLTLDSMLREFKQNHLSAFGKLHLALEPNETEMAERQSGYLELLVSPTSPVVSFAVKMLTKLGKSNDFDTRVFLESARPVFAHKQKGTATQVLKFTSRLCAVDDSLADAGFEIAIAAMAHASPDVQALALDLAESLLTNASEAQKAQLARQAKFVSPKLAARATALSGGSQAEEAASELIPEPADTANLAAAVERLPKAIRVFAGLEGEPLSDMPPPPRYSASSIPAMDDRPRFERVESPTQLVELAAQLVEGCDNENDIEKLLDGLARFGSDRDGDFEKLSAPLLHRLQQGQLSSYSIAGGWGGAGVVLNGLLRSWLELKKRISRRGPYYSETPRDTFGLNRLEEIQAVILGGNSAELLATPSWQDGGWIDPLDLVERLAGYEESRDPVLRYDFMQALLRLAPVNRPEALEKAGSLNDEHGAILRFALGGDDRPGRWARKLTPAWVCAARARDPFGSVRELLGPLARKVPNLADLLEPAEWHYEVVSTTKRGYTHTRVEIDGGYAIEIARKPLSLSFERRLTQKNRLDKAPRKIKWGEWPTAALTARMKSAYRDGSDFTTPWRIRWLATTWPQNPEAYLGSVVISLNNRMDMDSSRDEPLHFYLAALLDPIRPWGEMAVLALCMGLISKSTDTRGFAIDALIPGIESGKANVDAMAAAFATLFDDGHYKLNRFGDVMPQVLEVSPLHRWWVAAIVDQIVCGLENPPKNIYFLYDLALDAMLPIGARPSSAMADKIRTHKGSSKTAKLAKQLLTLEGQPVDEPGDAVIAEAWATRVAFAEQFREPPISS